MKIYHISTMGLFTGRTSEYAGKACPASATPVPPPDSVEGVLRRWTGSVWEYVTRESLLPPVQTITDLHEARANLKSAIAASRYTAEMSGVNYNVAGTDVRIPTDVDARTRLQSAIDAAPETGTIQYKLGGEFRSMTRADLIALRSAVSAHVQACFDREAELLAAIEAAETVEVVAGVEWDNACPGNEENASL